MTGKQENTKPKLNAIEENRAHCSITAQNGAMIAMNRMTRIALVISLAGFSITANTLPSLVTWFSDSLLVPSRYFGMVFLLQYAAFTLCSIGIGRLQKHMHVPLNGILIGALLTASLGIMVLGTINSFVSLMLVMILVGGAGGLVESIGTAVLSASDDQGKMIYLSQFLYAVGAFSAPLLVGILLKLGMTVPQIGMVTGGFAALVGITVLVLVRFGYEPAPIQTTILTEPVESMHNTYQETTFRWMFIAMISYVVLESVIGSWLPTYLVQSSSYSQADASLLLTGFWIGLGASRLFYIYYKKKNTTGPLLIHSMTILFGLILFAILRGSPQIFPMMIAILCIGIGCGPIWPLLIEHCSTSFADMHLVMYLVGAGSIGAILGPAITAILFGLCSITAYPLILPLYVFAMILAMMRVIKSAHQTPIS